MSLIYIDINNEKKNNFTAPSVDAVGKAIEHIFPLIHEFRLKRSAEDEAALLAKKRKTRNRRYPEEYTDQTDPVVEPEEMVVDSDDNSD